MTIITGKNNVYHLKKRSYRRHTLFYKREQRLMTKMILTVFAVLTIATAAYAQIPANKVIYNAPASAQDSVKTIETVKAVIITESVPMTIIRIAKERQFQWPNYLLALATCENDSFDPLRDNKGGNYPKTSIDRGQFMINDYWQKQVTDDQSHDIVFATNWTIDRINEGKQSLWVCDKTAKRIAKQIKGNVAEMNEVDILATVEFLKRTK